MMMIVQVSIRLVASYSVPAAELTGFHSSHCVCSHTSTIRNPHARRINSAQNGSCKTESWPYRSRDASDVINNNICPAVFLTKKHNLSNITLLNIQREKSNLSCLNDFINSINWKSSRSCKNPNTPWHFHLGGLSLSAVTRPRWL